MVPFSKVVKHQLDKGKNTHVTQTTTWLGLATMSFTCHETISAVIPQHPPKTVGRWLSNKTINIITPSKHQINMWTSVTVANYTALSPEQDEARAAAAIRILTATMGVNIKKLFNMKLCQWLIKINAETARWSSCCQRRSCKEQHGGQCCCCKEKG